MTSAIFDKVIKLEEDGKLTGIVVHDLKSRHQVFYKVSEMGAEDIQALFNKDIEIEGK